MKLESQVTSLDLSKRLRELGVGQSAMFFFWEFHNDTMKLEDRHRVPVLSDYQRERKNRGAYWTKVAAAFTVAELGVALPDSLEKNGRVYLLTVNRWNDDNKWQVSYLGGHDNDESFFEDFYALDIKEADSRAAMLAQLLAFKLITIEEVNARLEAA